MASYQAIIDLIVNGQNEVDRVIRSTDQLQAAIGRINSRPLELQPGRAQQSVERLTRSLQGIDRQVEQAAAHLTPLRNNFQAVSREAGTLDRALQRNSRSLEANRRQSQIYENTIRNAASGSVEFVNATAAGARAVVRNIRLTEQQTQLERRRAAVDARMTYQLRQMAGAETELAEAQERRGQAAASLGSARGFQVQIQFANRLASSYMDIAVSRERAEGTAQGARLPQFQSTAGLRSEIQFFDSLASSVATNTEAFKTFTIASRAASQSLAEVNRNRLAILAEAFTPDDPFGRMRGTSGRQLRNQDVSRTRQEVDRLIASFDQVPRSEAGLEDYIQRLGDLRSVVTFTSNAYRQLTDQMARVQALQASIPTMRGQASAISPLQGPASLLPQFSVESADKQARFREKQIADAWKMRGGPALPVGFTERGRVSSEFGALGTGFLPVSGKMPGGQRAVPGSPQAKKEEADLQKKINSALIQQEELQGRIDRANLTDFQRQELTNRLLSARDAILKGNFDTSRAISGQVDLTRYSYERYNRDLVKSNKLTSDLEKYTQKTFDFANKLEGSSPAVFDSSDLDAFVNRFSEIEGIYKDLNKESREAGKDFDRRLNATGPFRDRLVELQTLSADLTLNSRKGVQVDQERAKVASLIQKLESGSVQVNQRNLKLVSDMTTSLQKRLALRIREAKVAGTYDTGRGVGGGKIATPERLEDAVRKLLGKAISVEKQAISVQGKGVAGADELRLQVQEKINELKKIEGKITSDNAESVARDIGVLQRGIIDISNALGQARNQIVETAKLTGFDKSFEAFQDSLQQSRTFFENVSPAEAIDKIVREFNQGTLTGPEGKGGAATADNIIDTFSSSMKAGRGKAVSAASSVFNEVTQAINFAFGIASPSRFMIELVRNLANTYVSQLQKEYPRIKSATEKAFGQLGPQRPVKQLTATSRGFGVVDRSSTGFRPLASRAFDPSGAGGEMDEMFRRFRNQIAQLTTQPEIYRNILNALPSSSLTTDLAAVASRRAAASELPSFMPIQRQLGPGELEKAIQSQFAEYLKGIKIPNPWIGPIGDYRNFIAAITGETNKLSSLRRESQLALPAGRERLALPPGADFQAIAENRTGKALERSAERGAAVFAEDLERSARRVFGGGGGGLPPSPPTPPGSAPDDFSNRLTAASQQGVQGLLGLAELRDPSKVATARLEILSRVLQGVYSQLDPVAPGAKQLSKELRETIGTLNNLQASRAPDADFLVRLTKNPRLAAGISEGLIGGAFPLLFGQGVGAAAGGGIGGFAGGYAGGALGFGLSLIGTAVGSAVDIFANNLKELSSSLKQPTATLEAMKAAGLRVGPELEDLVSRLEGVGNAAAAQALVFEEIEKRLGTGGVQKLNALNEEQKRLEESWSVLVGQLQSSVIPAIIGFTIILRDVVGIISAVKNFNLDENGNRKNQRFNPFTGKFTDIDEGRSADTRKFNPFTGQFEKGLGERVKDAIAEASTGSSLTPEDQRKQELLPFQQTVAALSAGLEASDIAKKYTDAIKTAAEEQKDLDKQRFELIESYEQSIADIRKGVEQKITQERLSVAAKENELFAAQGDIRLQQLRNANAELRAGLFGNEIGQQLADVVSEFTEKQLSTENEIANRRRSLELELESRKIEIEQYKIDVATQVSKLNISTQRQVEKIQDGILKKNQAYDRSRFEIEKRININNLEIKRLEAKQQENLFRTASSTAASTGNAALAKQNRELADLYANQARFIDAQKNAVRGFAPPPQLSFRPASASASVSTAGLDAVAARGNQLLASIAGAKDELSLLASSNDFTGFNSRLKEIADQGVAGLANQFERLKGELSGDPLGAQFAKIKEAFETISEVPELAPYKELILEYGKLAKENLKLGTSLEFFLDKAGEQSSQLDSLRIEINSAISGSTELEKALTDLAMRGISPASEEFKILTENAAKLDQLQQKLEIINSFKTASSELTLSLRGLIENFYELGSASEAVKRVGEELSRKSLGFVLDIAFKPVEQAMQKTMFDLAERFGFDIKPEALQQLEEIKILKDLVASIEREIVNKKSTALPATLGPQGPSSTQILTEEQLRVQGLVRGLGQQIQKRVEEVSGGQELEVLRGTLKGEVNLLLPPTGIDSDQFKLIKEGASSEVDRQINEKIQKLYPQLPSSQQLSPQSSLPGTGFNMASLSKLSRDYGSIASARSAFSLPEDGPVRQLPVDSYTGVEKEVKGATGAIGELKEELKGVPPAVAPVIEGTKDMVRTSVDSSDKITETLQESGQKLVGTIVPQWTKSLGQVVTGLGMASSAVIGIVGGIQNIKQGGAGNIFTGIGSILTTIGGIGMSAAGFMKPGGFGGPAAAGNSPWTSAVNDIIANANGNAFENGKLMKFANGGILQSPTLFNFEDAGVTRTGQAGEAGAEAIMPLKRTKDGRLGVEADLSVPFEGGSIMLDEEPATGAPGASSIPFRSRSGVDGQQSLSIPFMRGDGMFGADGSGSTDTIRFESTVINGVEFVTRDEAEEIGRRSESRGAARGAELAHRRIRNNPQTRRSIGMQ
jgi:hypothetical protein